MLQFVLVSKPEKAHFLNAEEKQWLQNRQDRQHQLSSERNPHQGAWWGEPLSHVRAIMTVFCQIL